MQYKSIKQRETFDSPFQALVWAEQDVWVLVVVVVVVDLAEQQLNCQLTFARLRHRQRLFPSLR